MSIIITNKREKSNSGYHEQTIMPCWGYSCQRELYEHSNRIWSPTDDYRCGGESLLSIGSSELDNIYEHEYMWIEDVLNDPSKLEENREYNICQEKSRYKMTKKFANGFIRDISSHNGYAQRKAWSDKYWCRHLLDLKEDIKNSIRGIFRDSFFIRIVDIDIALTYGCIILEGLYCDPLSGSGLIPIQFRLECLNTKDQSTGKNKWSLCHLWIDTKKNIPRKLFLQRAGSDLYQMGQNTVKDELRNYDEIRAEADSKIDQIDESYFIPPLKCWELPSENLQW